MTTTDPPRARHRHRDRVSTDILAVAASLLALAAPIAGCATAVPPNMGPPGVCDAVPPPDSVGMFPPIFLNPEAVGLALTRERNRERDRATEFGRSTALAEALFLLLVDERGRVADTRTEVSTGQPEVDRAILRAFRIARFRPGTLNCKPAKMWFPMPMAASIRARRQPVDDRGDCLALAPHRDHHGPEIGGRPMIVGRLALPAGAIVLAGTLSAQLAVDLAGTDRIDVPIRPPTRANSALTGLGLTRKGAPTR